MPKFIDRDLHRQIDESRRRRDQKMIDTARSMQTYTKEEPMSKQKIKDDDIQFYWAYGSNLNKKHMRRRCPDARPYKPLILKNAQLVFRGVADAVALEGSTCPGGLWKVTRKCLRSLDRYEGCDPDNPESKDGLYRRKFINIRTRDANDETREYKALYYQMNRPGIAPPGEFYLNTIIEGYGDFGLDLNDLNAAVVRSYDEKEWTPALRDRHEARGQRLAKKSRVSDILDRQVVDVE